MLSGFRRRQSRRNGLVMPGDMRMLLRAMADTLRLYIAAIYFSANGTTILLISHGHFGIRHVATTMPRRAECATQLPRWECRLRLTSRLASHAIHDFDAYDVARIIALASRPLFRHAALS